MNWGTWENRSRLGGSLSLDRSLLYISVHATGRGQGFSWVRGTEERWCHLLYEFCDTTTLHDARCCGTLTGNRRGKRRRGKVIANKTAFTLTINRGKKSAIKSFYT